jgi:hypothetical protein
MYLVQFKKNSDEPEGRLTCHLKFNDGFDSVVTARQAIQVFIPGII